MKLERFEKDGKKGWKDSDGNSWFGVPKSLALEMAETLVDCKNCVDCDSSENLENCVGCSDSENLKNCSDCHGCENLENKKDVFGNSENNWGQK